MACHSPPTETLPDGGPAAYVSPAASSAMSDFDGPSACKQQRDVTRGHVPAVDAPGTSLHKVFGVGPIVVCMLTGYSGDLRFTTPSRYAGDTGTPTA